MSIANIITLLGGVALLLLGLVMFLAMTSESWCLWQGLPHGE